MRWWLLARRVVLLGYLAIFLWFGISAATAVEVRGSFKE
jgi:hypothetical protein